MSRSIVVAVVVSALFLFSGVVYSDDDPLVGKFCSMDRSDVITFSSSGRMVWSSPEKRIHGQFTSNDGVLEVELADGDLLMGSVGYEQIGFRECCYKSGAWKDDPAAWRVNRYTNRVIRLEGIKFSDAYCNEGRIPVD